MRWVDGCWEFEAKDKESRYEEALREIAAHEAGGDWFVQGIIDIAKDALAETLRGLDD